METFLLVFVFGSINFFVFKMMEDYIVDLGLPKWLKLLLLLIPPFSIIFLVLFCLLMLCMSVFDTIKNL